MNLFGKEIEAPYRPDYKKIVVLFVDGTHTDLIYNLAETDEPVIVTDTCVVVDVYGDENGNDTVMFPLAAIKSISVERGRIK